MAGTGDLLRSMRSGGGTGLTAAREFIRLAQSGQVSQGEIREAQRVVNSLELKDTFGAVAQEFAQLTGGGERFQTVKSLMPDTARLSDAKSMPERFMGDLTLVEHQLLNGAGMTGAEKATRLFEFFEVYASRFQELAHDPQQGKALTEGELNKVLAQFDKALTRAGFQHLTTGDGRTGMEAARQMLEAKTTGALAEARPREIDAPGWKDKPIGATEVDRQRRAVEMGVHQLNIQQARVLTAQQMEDKKKEEDEKRRKDRSSNKVLGGRMVWNVLHMLRGDDLNDVQRRDAMNQLIVAAALVLIFIGIIVAVLVSM